MAFGGTAQFVFQEVNGRQTVHMQYLNLKGVGVDSGTQYVVTEHDKYVTIVNIDNGGIKFETSISGNFISHGSDTNTIIKLKLITVFTQMEMRIQ